jgi:regulator of nucleoside diphosphate kinase
MRRPGPAGASHYGAIQRNCPEQKSSDLDDRGRTTGLQMPKTAKAGRKPAITVARSEHDRLLAFANTIAEQNPESSEELLLELERARVVNDDRVPDNVVRIGSSVKYEPDTGETRTVTLVYPGEADISLGKVSVLTPIGTALLGLSPGQAIAWTARDGRRHELHVLDVEPPSALQNTGAAA